MLYDQHMKYFYYIAFALMIVSCGDDNIVKDAPITLASPGKTLEISRDPAFACDFHETANPVDIIIMQDSFLLLYDAIVENKNNDFYKAYSLDDYSYRGKFGSYGRGPDEFLSPDLSACFKYSGSNIVIQKLVKIHR